MHVMHGAASRLEMVGRKCYGATQSGCILQCMGQDPDDGRMWVGATGARRMGSGVRRCRSFHFSPSTL